MDSESGGNRLRKVRLAEGLSKAELARLAGISAQTITNIENSNHSARPETKHKIVNGLNRNPDKIKTYAVEDVFPDYR